MANSEALHSRAFHLGLLATSQLTPGPIECAEHDGPKIGSDDDDEESIEEESASNDSGSEDENSFHHETDEGKENTDHDSVPEEQHRCCCDQHMLAHLIEMERNPLSLVPSLEESGM